MCGETFYGAGAWEKKTGEGSLLTPWRGARDHDCSRAMRLPTTSASAIDSAALAILSSAMNAWRGAGA